LDVRFIAATNQDIAAALEEGTFRKDLYYRINTLTIEIPPLRERKEDIPLLAHHFMSRYAGIHQKMVASIAPDVIEYFMHYSWPGNVRELEKVIERGVVLSKGPILDVGGLTDGIRASQPSSIQSESVSSSMSASVELLEKKMIQDALDTTNGNREKAAKVLGISLRSLQYKIKKYFS
jgi:transcriptional regulator with PAS, ATPase and Fis domain